MHTCHRFGWSALIVFVQMTVAPEVFAQSDTPTEVVIETHDGKTYVGVVLRELEQGLLVRTIEEETLVIPFTTIKDIYQVIGADEVPERSVSPPAPAPTHGKRPPASDLGPTGSGWIISGWIMTGIGALVGGVGLVMLADRSDTSDCPDGDCSSEPPEDVTELFVIGGGLVLAAGIVMLIIGYDQRSDYHNRLRKANDQANLTLLPVFGPEGFGLQLHWVF